MARVRRRVLRRRGMSLASEKDVCYIITNPDGRLPPTSNIDLRNHYFLDVRVRHGLCEPIEVRFRKVKKMSPFHTPIVYQ